MDVKSSKMYVEEKNWPKSWRAENTHKLYNVRCRHNYITPNSIRLKRTVSGQTAAKIVASVEKKLLKERKRQCDYICSRLLEEMSGLKSELTSRLPSDIWEDVNKLFTHAHEDEFATCKQRQRDKSDNLKQKNEAKKRTENVSTRRCVFGSK